MTGKKISLYILAAFIAGTVLLIYIQYNSSKNINSLVEGNQNLIDEFKLNAQLKALEKDIVTVESKVRTIVATGDSSNMHGLQNNFSKIDKDLNVLKKIADDDSSDLYIDELITLVQQKLLRNRQILDTFYLAGKARAENFIANSNDNMLTDSIITVADKIDSSRQVHLSTTNMSIDKSGEKARQFSTILIVFVLIGNAVLFWYIINIIRKQASLIVQLNISEKKVKEAAQMKENFMANMSHEIRTPMNAILGFTNLLQRRNLDGESKEFVQTIQRSGENLLAIIDDILDLSKIEAGMMRIDSSAFSIRGLLNSIEVMLRPKATQKQLRLVVKTQDSVPDMLEGDAFRLTQILVNLVSNALKFTDEGSVTVNVTNEVRTGDVINTRITVSDTGIGIDKAKVHHIFGRFQQAENAVTRKYGGTGLGLSIVKELVLLQNGTIDVDSEPGKGTTFSLIIPYKISTPDVITAPVQEDTITAASNFDRQYILVAEDNKINQSLLKHLFKSWNLKFDLANNGKEAIEKLRSKNYDLILMDIQMPEMDGYTAAQEIREKLKLTTPIIAMTAHALAGEREKCLGYGMNGYISKPIREIHLHNLIAQFTALEIADILPSEPIAGQGGYNYINLQYMREISLGNIEYEKTVTQQFIDAIPIDLLMLERASQDNDTSKLRQVAHNMKTTISVMALNEMLQPYLDALEYEDQTQESFARMFESVNLICKTAVEEAGRFLLTR
jgi:signal transduction histidine kinase/CheY-like chemotaxis protein